VNLWLARLFQVTGRDEEAIPFFDRAIRFQTADSGVKAIARVYRTLSAGRLLEKQGKLDQAIETYQEGLSHEPVETNRFAFYLLTQLIEALERKGAPAEAVLRLLPDYVKAKPGNEYVDALKRGDLLARWGRPREAIESYAKWFWSAGPYENTGELKLMKLLTSSGLLDETLEALRKQAGANPGSLKVCLPLCIVLEQTGRRAEAIATWERAAASNDSRDWRYQHWVRYGDALARANKLTEAAEAYLKVMALYPGNPWAKALQFKVARVRVARAEALRAKGNGQEAADDYREAIKVQPGNTDLYGKLGMALLGLKGMARNDLAAGCREAVALYPNSPYAHLALGQALCLTDRAGALAAQRKAIELNPQDALAYRGLGDLLADPRFARSPGKEDVASALAAYSKCIELQPTEWACWRARGDLYQRLGKWESALADYDKAVAMWPEDYFVLLERGKVRARLGQWDQAITDYSRALLIPPDFQTSHVRHSEYFRSLGGAEHFKVMLRSPTFQALNLRGEANQRLGKWDQAVADYAEAIRLNPKDWLGRNNLAWVLATCPDPMIRNPPRAVELARKAQTAFPAPRTSGTRWVPLTTGTATGRLPSPRSTNPWNCARAGTPSTGSSWPWPNGNWVTPTRRANGSTGQLTG
jgi:tetratricopeptide (TPR) repeat protein